MIRCRVFVTLAVACLATSLSSVPVQAQDQSFAVGEKVLLEASRHWIPCTVAEASPNAPMRVDCPAYPALSRSAGRYIVHDRTPAGIRRAADGVPIAATPQPANAAQATRPAAQGGGLKLGEYACYGAGGRPMVGLGFKVLAGGRYTDLDGANAGTISVVAGAVKFTGGHMSEIAGRDFNPADGSFRVGAQALCEPW
jgi:hypothetical protein